jgi:hypothetical protein
VDKETNFILYLKVHGNRDNSPNDLISNELENESDGEIKSDHDLNDQPNTVEEDERKVK